MKSTGIVRLVDELGRVVLPIELRRVLEIGEKDPIEFFVDDSRIILRKYQTQACLFCQSADDLAYFRGRFVCSSCLDDVRCHVTPELAMQESAAASESEPVKPKSGRKGNGAERLAEVMRSYPDATQTEWARMIGITPGRVSQILRKGSIS